ncbi:MAG TPA: DUF4112 domain-containing protein [Ferruginibacter sp.]|jgi:hypothetical protein|nr:DUF4112 domain-containing protein [Bacteroidota bacterium]MCC6693931.1 DUF4112 domain-containing protein [Chitinophagaceae bacterium]HMT96244.1 DUF4112 domain-containing protein [Ferruginibacter sp.]HMU23425.1 DUF4112 domain-containing protein [Ferruginibacter sp.]
MTHTPDNSLNKDAAARLALIKRVSKLMDEEFRIGKYKFGLDPILNFIPVAGDLAGYLISATLLLTMVKHGASGKLVIKMLGNIFIDALVGAIPVLGWVFDFVFKANKKNVQLLEEHYVLGKHTGSAKPYILAIVLILFFTIAILLILSIWFLKAIADLFNMRLI